MNIHRPKPGDYVYYHLSSASRTQVGFRLIEFVHQKVIRMSLASLEEEEAVYEYNLEAQQMAGTALLHQWAADMENLQTPLILVLDNKGKLKDIRRFNEMYQKWTGYFADRLRKKYKESKEGAEALIGETVHLLKDKQRFLESLSGYSAWRFFFQDDFDGQQGMLKHHLILKGFFGQVNLPLILESSWREEYGINQYSCSLENKGMLDQEHFDRKSFARMLKDVTGVYNINAKLDVSMEERFLYNKHHWLTEAEMYLEARVSDWYAVTTAHTLVMVSEKEATRLKEKFREEEFDPAGSASKKH